MAIRHTDFQRIRTVVAAADVDEPLTAREILALLEDRGEEFESAHEVATVPRPTGRPGRRGDHLRPALPVPVSDTPELIRFGAETPNCSFLRTPLSYACVRECADERDVSYWIGDVSYRIDSRFGDRPKVRPTPRQFGLSS